jgi:hypothetical protein
MTFEEVRRLALSLPGVTEATSYGAPAFRLGKKLLACQPANPRLRDDGRVLVLMDVDLDERDELVRQEPDAFFFTDHYRGYPAVLVRLPAIAPERLRPYLERSWRLRAPKRLREGGDR